MQKKIKITIILFIAFWFISGTFMPNVQEKNKDTEKNPYKNPYEIARIETINSQLFNDSVIAHGIVKPAKEQKIILDKNRIVEKVFVKNGEKVKKEQIISLLGTFNERKNALNILRQLQQKLYYESRRLDNEIKNNKSKAQPSSNLDNLIKSIQSAEYNVSQFIIVSKIDGYVININLQENSYAPEYNNKVMNPIVEIADINDLFVDIEISDAYIGKISPSLSAVRAVTADKKAIPGKILFSGYKVDEITGTFDVRVHLPNTSAVMSGSKVKVEITTLPVDTFLIPNSSITTDAKGYPIIKIIKDQTVKNYDVNIIREDKSTNKTWIAAPNPSTVDVIVMGSPLFTDGQKVDITKFTKNKEEISHD